MKAIALLVYLAGFSLFIPNVAWPSALHKCIEPYDEADVVFRAIGSYPTEANAGREMAVVEVLKGEIAVSQITFVRDIEPKDIAYSYSRKFYHPLLDTGETYLIYAKKTKDPRVYAQLYGSSYCSETVCPSTSKETSCASLSSCAAKARLESKVAFDPKTKVYNYTYHLRNISAENRRIKRFALFTDARCDPQPIPGVWSFYDARREQEYSDIAFFVVKDMQSLASNSSITFFLTSPHPPHTVQYDLSFTTHEGESEEDGTVLQCVRQSGVIRGPLLPKK